MDMGQIPQMTYSQEVFWLYGFEKTGEARRLDPDRRIRLGRAAEECGRQYACRVRERYPGCTGRELLRQLGFALEEEAWESPGPVLTFACFEPPDRIRLSRAAAAMEESRQNIVLHHELFHGLESRDAKRIATRQTIPVKEGKKFGPRRRFLALSEIGAMAFAQELDRLPYSPFWLDVVLTRQLSPATSLRILETLDACHSIAVKG